MDQLQRDKGVCVKRRECVLFENIIPEVILYSSGDGGGGEAEAICTSSEVIRPSHFLDLFEALKYLI